MKVIGEIKEGRGVFVTKTFRKNVVVCNYGGKFMNVKFTLELLQQAKLCDYLFELHESYRGNYTHFYLNHDSVSEREIGNTFGKFINHSSIHANIGTKVFIICESELDVLFYSLRKINVGEQLLWDYSKNFDCVSNCMKDCV